MQRKADSKNRIEERGREWHSSIVQNATGEFPVIRRFVPIANALFFKASQAQGVPPRFILKEAPSLYPQVSGTVYIDGLRIGSAGRGASFTVQLSAGLHNIVIESVEKGGFHKRENSECFTLNIPKGTKQMTVQLCVREGITNFLSGAGKWVVVDSAT